MKLLEYKAKELFEKYQIPTMNGFAVNTTDGIDKKIEDASLTYPVVLKAQVQIGGRGKAGGIKFADNATQVKELSEQIMGMDIRGLTVEELMIVEKASPSKEFYLSIMLDRLSKAPLLIFSPAGGVDIEETAKTNPELIAKVPICPVNGVKPYTIDYIIDKTGCDPAIKPQLSDIVSKLYDIFFDYSTMLVEINPLALDDSGKIIALDGKVEIDDSALFRLPDMQEYAQNHKEGGLVGEAADYRFHYVPIDEGGKVGVMSNGSGMLMSCIDLLSKAGVNTACALDLGGGATAERIMHAVRIVLSNDNVNCLFVCIFGGITRCDEVACGIKAALEHTDPNKKIVVRMEGTNKDKGIEILRNNSRVTYVQDIPGGVATIKAEV